jgi:succinate dehydrogenase hydrophobic anchor subunit
MSSASPRTRRDFYPFAIHIINAAIIAFSFELLKDNFIPIELIKTFSDQVNFVAVLFVWGFLISGWLGYTKSVSDKPHKEGLVGNLRFVVELIISFFMLYLFIIAEKIRFDIYFGSAFVWVIPAIFGLFIIWDILKFIEYRNEYHVRRMLLTIFASLAILALDLFYNVYAGNLVAGSALDKNWTFLAAIGASSVIIGTYRVFKGNISGTKVEVS